MRQKQKIFFFLFFISTSTVFAQLGNKCTNQFTFNEGTCKLESECPSVQEQAEKGIPSTICGYYDFTQTIVCCDDSVQPHDLSIPYENENNTPHVNANTSLRKSEQKCDEYSQPVEEVISVLGLATDESTTSIKVAKCKYNGVPLIVGGTTAEPGEFPFMALVGFNTNDAPWKCGGTLISDRFIVTAAHCTFSRDAGKPTVVRLGELDLTADDADSTRKDYVLSNIINHPNYSHPYNDIALLKTRDPIIFTSFIRPACLHWRPEIKSDKAMAIGFGKTEFTGESSDKLLKVTLDLFNNQHPRCVKTYPPNSKDLPIGIVPSMLCAGVLKGGMDTCQGDSGGPLVVTKPENLCQFYLVGVTSFGKICGLRNTPAIYTKIPEYVDWIESEVW